MLCINKEAFIKTNIPPVLHIPSNSGIFLNCDVKSFDLDTGYVSFSAMRDNITKKWIDMYMGKTEIVNNCEEISKSIFRIERPGIYVDEYGVIVRNDMNFAFY